MNDNRWSANVALRSGLGAREQSGSSSGGGSSLSAGGKMQHSSGAGGGSGGSLGMNNGESGILRKPGHHHHHHHFYHQDNFADLLVFGYSCKVFRDDEKARFIDQGRHLIPWMGDNQLKIDRYDARGALHDLSQHEPPLGGYGNRFDCLPPAEQRAEQLCEEERYYSLYANEVEEEIEQEEAAKRAAAAGAQIAFDYDAPAATVVGPEPAAPGDDDDENSCDPPFVAPANFEIPSELDVPDTMKEHAIIEKTAKFIASQDSQMEILLRAKQAANPQFGFLSPGGRLYRYYRHMLMAIKTNQYPEEVPEEEANGAEEATEDAAAAAEPSPEKPTVVVPTIKYKPSIDCAYTQLISKITGAPIPTKDKAEEDLANESGSPSSATVQPSELELAPEVPKVSTGLAGLVQYDSDSEESGNEAVEEKKEKKPEPEMVRREITFSGKLPPEIFQHVIEKTATYVAKNGYSFEDALRTKNDPRFLFLRKDHEFYPFYAFRVRYLISPFEEVPKSPEKVTITREIENGTVVETPSIGIKTVNTAAPLPVPAPQTQIQANKPGGAVCFSIKSKDDATVAALKSSNVAQELGGGDEEEPESKKESEKEKEKERSKSPVSVVEAVEPVKEPSVEKEKVEEEVKTIVKSSTPPPVDAVVPPVQELKSSTPPLEDCKPPIVVSTTPPDSTAADNTSKDQKRLEDRIKDKLAVAARERLASITKEKQLQLERKKRASMFLSLINKNEPDQTVDEPPPAKKPALETTPEPESFTAQETAAKNGLELLKNQFSDQEDEKGDGDGDDGNESSDSSEMSVHSIPSVSDSPDSKQAPSSADDDVVFVAEDNDGGRPSRSRTRSKSISVSGSSKPKKRKHKHKSKSKKSKKKKNATSRSRSRTPSKKTKRKRSRSRSKSSRRSRSRSPPIEKDSSKKKKKKSKKKSHKHSKTSRSSSSSRHHHKKEHRETEERDSDYWV
nr:protein suppressor of white apricot [Aedes albopictus]